MAVPLPGVDLHSRTKYNVVTRLSPGLSSDQLLLLVQLSHVTNVA